MIVHNKMLHNTAQTSSDNFPLILQTIIIAQMCCLNGAEGHTCIFSLT